VTVADEAQATATRIIRASLPPWLDYGDAPDSYATLRASNGARHAIGSGLFLGAAENGDADGHPAADALADSSDDGVTFGSILRQGQTATVRVHASQAGRLDAFLDFNADGDFADAGEKIFSSVAVTAGDNDLSFSIPANAVSGDTFARFRLSSVGGLSFDGLAGDGEVEDYRVTLGVEQAYTPIGPGRYRFDAYNLTPGAIVTFVYGTTPGTYPFTQYGISLGVTDPVYGAQGAADQNGHAMAILNIPSAQPGQILYLQAFELAPRPQVSPLEAIVVPLERHFDFATPSSLLETGYMRVSSGTTYTPAQGYGWLAGTIVSVDRETGTTLDRDLNLTPRGTFVVDLPNGTYRVDLRLGDPGSFAHEQMEVSLEGVPVDTVTTSAGQLVSRSYTVKVTDGRMNLDMEDLGGRDKNVAIAGMSVSAILPDTSGPTVMIGGATSAGAPFGGLPLLVDIVFSEPVTGFTADDVSLSFNGPGTLTKSVTGSGSTYQLSVSGMTGSGTLGVRMDSGAAFDLSGNSNVASSQATIDYRYGKRFDFGTRLSPLADGYLQVTENTAYTTALGYGWTVGTVRSVDRRIGDALGRDLNLTADATFVVDVPNGTYNVTVGLGDLGRTAHDQMAVYLEGVAVDTVSTDAESLLTTTYQVTVSDGQLTLRVKDWGGTDRNVALAAFTLSDAGSPVSSAASAEPESLFVIANPVANPVLTPDLNGDSFATPLDALLAVNYLNATAPGDPAADDLLFPDVNGDGLVTPLDVLLVINYVNRHSLLGAEGEGIAWAASAPETGRPSLLPANTPAPPAETDPVSPTLGHAGSLSGQPSAAPAGDSLPAAWAGEPSPAEDWMEDVLEEIATDVFRGWETGDAAAGAGV